MSFLDTTPFQLFLTKLLSRSELSREEQAEILGLPGHPAQYETSRDFVKLGERVDHSCLVVEGMVGRFGQNQEGGRQITAVHVAGDMVDLHSVMMPEAASALQALTVTTVLRVPHEALRRIAYAHPAIGEALWRECVVDAAVLSEWVVNVGRRTAQARIAHLMCELACRYDAVGESDQFDFPFLATQNHLADMVGLTSVHVNRTLKELREKGAMILNRRVANVISWSKLVQIGQFDPNYLQMDGSALRESKAA